MTFGEKLHMLRSARGMTLQDLAHATGYVTHGYLSEIESGRKHPTVAFVLKVAALFEVSTDVLLRDDLRLPKSRTKSS